MKKQLSLFLLTLFLCVGCGGGSDVSSADSDTNTGQDSNEDTDSNNDSPSDDSTDDSATIDDVTPNGASALPYADSTGRVSYKRTIKLTGTQPGGATSTIDVTEDVTEVFSNFGSTKKIESLSESVGVFIIPGLETININTSKQEASKIIDNVIYVADFEKMEIRRTDLTDLATSLNEVANVIAGGDASQYEEIGTDSVLGLTCRNFKVEAPIVGTATTCFHRGIPLKTTSERSEQTADGLSTYSYTEIATNVDLNVVLSEGELDLPDFPVINGAQLNNDESNVGKLYLITVNATPPSCTDGEGALVVTNDVITGSVQMDDGNTFTVNGEIGPDNTIYGGYVRDNFRVAEYSGTRSETGSLSGTWNSLADECFGTWSD